MNNSTFYILTTGLAYNIHSHNLLLHWNDILIKILDLISSRYSRIEIYNSDILYEITDKEKRNDIINKMNKDMLKYIKDRVKICKFIDYEFEIYPKELYILIDCAHIYNYINEKGYVKRNNHYNENKQNNKLQINSIYFGNIKLYIS
jgi:hypothetical protein